MVGSTQTRRLVREMHVIALWAQLCKFAVRYLARNSRGDAAARPPSLLLA